MLSTNGFRDVWMNPQCSDLNTFHKLFMQRLNDQYYQNLSSTIRSSSRFNTLRTLKDDTKESNYLSCIRNPEIRLIFTRLRIDMNCLATCKTKRKPGQIHSNICPLCSIENETVEHFLLKCGSFNDIRQRFLSNIKTFSKYFNDYDDTRKIRYILDVDCPPDAIKICCSFISEMYKKREIS